MWTVEFERKADRALAAMHPQMRRRISDAIDRLVLDPFAMPNVKALSGSDQFRLRVGGYRVVYRLEGNLLIVVVIDVGPRGGIYA
jgi:mRNA interferase RelE/StbE